MRVDYQHTQGTHIHISYGFQLISLTQCEPDGSPTDQMNATLSLSYSCVSKGGMASGENLHNEQIKF